MIHAKYCTAGFHLEAWHWRPRQGAGLGFYGNPHLFLASPERVWKINPHFFGLRSLLSLLSLLFDFCLGQIGTIGCLNDWTLDCPRWKMVEGWHPKTDPLQLYCWLRKSKPTWDFSDHHAWETWVLERLNDWTLDCPRWKDDIRKRILCSFTAGWGNRNPHEISLITTLERLGCLNDWTIEHYIDCRRWKDDIRKRILCNLTSQRNMLLLSEGRKEFDCPLKSLKGGWWNIVSHSGKQCHKPSPSHHFYRWIIMIPKWIQMDGLL